MGKYQTLAGRRGGRGIAVVGDVKLRFWDFKKNFVEGFLAGGQVYRDHG